MLAEFQSVWTTLGDIISALPNTITIVVCTVFCYVGIVGIMKSL